MKKYLFLISLVLLNFLAMAQTPNPIASYPFSGNANDAVGTNNGTVNGATLTTDRFGNANSAYSFDGVDDNISIADNAVFNFTNYSISVWFKYNAPGTAGKSIWSLISKNAVGNGFDDAFHMWVNATTKELGGRVGNGSLEFYLGNPPAVDNGQWHQSILVFDNSNNVVNLYLDGVLISSVVNTSNPFNNGSNIKIGFWEAFNNYFNGYIDDIKIYNTALTPSQVAAEYTSSSLVASYPFTGNANDAVGANNGTVNGAILTTDRFGNANSAYSFDGVDDFIGIGSLNFATNDYTISYWVNVNTNNADIAVVSGNDPAALNQTFIMSGFSGGVGRFLHRNPSGATGGVNLAGIQALTLGQWKFITCIKQGTTLTYYVNGVADNTITDVAATNISSAIYLEFGRLMSSAFTPIYHLNGKIDEVKIYNTSLTAAQVLAEYNATSNNGLVASYPFNGTANDAAGTNHGTVNGASLTTDRFGNANSAYSFDGVDDNISTSNLALTQTDNWTIMAWVKPASINQIGFMLHNGSLNASNGFGMVIDNGSSTTGTSGAGNVFSAFYGSVQYVSSGSSFPQANNWYHVTMVRQNGVTKFYSNGQQTPNTSTASVNAPVGSLIIGGVPLTGFNFNGSIDEVKIYNEALSPAQVIAEYNATNGLAAYYPFSGNANDAVGTNNGTVNGASLTIDRNGIANKAYSFDGVNDKITAPLSVTATNNFSMSGWVKLNNLGTNQMLFYNGNSSSNGYGLYLLSNGNLNVIHGGLNLYATTATLNTNQWYFLAMVRQAGNTKVYVNGNEVFNAATNTPNPPNDLFYMSSNTIGTEFFNGIMDDVKMYNTAISASQIQTEYSNSLPSLIAYYKFNNTPADSSGNNLHGTIIGTPTFTVDRNGNANSAMSFNGNVANRIEVDDNLLLHTPSITIGAWVKFNSLGSIKTIVDKPLGGNVSDSWHFGTENGNFSCWHFNSTNTNPYTQVTSAISTNQWYYIVNTFDDASKQHKLYVDGVLKMTNTFNSTIGYDNSKMYIGAAIENGGLNFPMDGEIDEVKIYGSALTASQILDEFENEVVANKPGSGDGISLDGSNDFVQLPSVLDGATQFTVDFWIKTTENRSSGTYWQKPSILGNGNPSGPDGDFGISTSNGFIGVWHGFCCGDQSFETTKAINDNLWHHVAAVNDGSNVVLFVDGIQQAGSIPTGGGALQNAARPWRLGMINSCCAGDTPHQGTLDEFRIWNTALTQTQIRDRMCKKIVSTDALYSNLSAYYNFDEKAGSTVFDGSANSNTATLHNGASRITSGAPIGNTSSHDYSGASSSTNLANPTLGDDVTTTLTSGGASGIHVYHVNEAPNSVSGVEGLENIGTYFGTFVAGGSSPQYNVVYNYDGISGISNESNLVLGTRANNSVASWAGITAALNTTANTLSVNAISNSQAEFRVAAQDAGLVSSSQANCFSYSPNPLTATPAFNNNLSATYQWQDSSVNATWQNISGATNLAGLTLPVATSTKYYRRLATLNGSTIFSNVVTIEASTGPNPATFPNNAWNFYAYDGVSTDSANILYKGSYSRNSLDFNTQIEFSTNPSTATGYVGCPIIAPGNAWTLHAKRQGFPTGPYTLVVNQHDDNLKILKDGVEVINGGCCNNLGTTIITLGTLSTATKIECRVANGGGPGHLQITLQMQSLNAGVINGAQTICTASSPTLLTNQTSAFGGNTSTITYQWQDSIANGTWTNISGAINTNFQPSTLTQTTWYRRLAINNIETLASNTIQITVNTVVGNPALLGINQWNVYAYNGTNLNLGSGNIYRGFYTNTNLNINTNNDWNSSLSPSAAANYQGCPVDVDNFTWIMKRQGFPFGNYFVDMPVMDNDFTIFVNSSQVYQHIGGCCGPYNGIALGILNATSTVEIRVNDLGSPGEARVNFISDLQAGTIGSNQIICNTTAIPNLFTSTQDAYGGLTTISYQWQDSIVGGTWQNISGANSTTFQAPATTQDIYYRRKASNVANEIAFSNNIFIDFQGVLFYQDNDGDGSGNPLVSQLACSAPMGYVSNNHDCNDNDVLERPNQVWYVDADGDGYSKGAAIQQCTRPSNGYVFSELTSINTDCNDNNNHIHPGAQYITYSGAPNYTNNIVYPLTGDPFTNYRYEVMYFNIYNELPENGAPRLSVDFNQDFILDLIDKRVSMLPDDVNDLNTQDGKKYYMNITGLQPGIPIQSYVSPYLLNCNYFGPFTNSPQVLTSPNLSILAQDITFSNYTPSVSSPITVSATVNNESDFQATNFTVKLMNMFDTSISYPINTVAFVPAHSNTTVTWNITTPAIASLCPMKVIIDFNNTIIETNEFDNVAIRGFANGGGSAQGGISVNTQVSPSTVFILPGQSGTVNLTGQAIYTGLANPLINASVSGAQVACTIIETGQTFLGNTDAQGNFSIPIATPVGLGIYHISGTVYDFTWTGSFTGTNNQFEVLDAVIVQGNNLPQLQPSINVTATSLLVGNSITVNFSVSNNGTADATSPFKTKLIITGPSNFLVVDSFTTSQLNMGSTSNTVTVTTGIINTPGIYYVTVIADIDESIQESVENDNTQTIAVTVLAPTVDLVAQVASTPLVVCTNQIAVNAAIQNAGSIPSSASQAVIRLKENGLVIDTALIPMTAINANESLPISHTFTPTFAPHNFTFEVVADRLNSNVESSELNNISTVQIFVDTCKPDLKMADECQAVAVDALNNDYTGPVTLSALITNTGDRNLQQPLTIRFDFMNGTFYDQVLNTPLNINTSITVQTTIPSLPVGATQLKVIIDPANAVVEKNETDNESSVKAIGKDYSPTNSGCTASIPNYNYHVGGFFYLYSPILSNNLFKTDSLTVNFKISGPGIVGIQNLGDAKLYNVNPTCVCPAVASIPSVYLISQQGLYHIYVTTDPNNDILETDETNNVLDIPILVQDKSDMVMTSSFINPSNLNPIAGQSITTQVTYENIGNENLSDMMKLKLIIDNVVVDSISNASGLIQNGKATVNFTTPWSSIQPGVHLIRAIIDADNTIVRCKP